MFGYGNCNFNVRVSNMLFLGFPNEISKEIFKKFPPHFVSEYFTILVLQFQIFFDIIKIYTRCFR